MYESSPHPLPLTPSSCIKTHPLSQKSITYLLKSTPTHLHDVQTSLLPLHLISPQWLHVILQLCNQPLYAGKNTTSISELLSGKNCSDEEGLNYLCQDPIYVCFEYRDTRNLSAREIVSREWRVMLFFSETVRELPPLSWDVMERFLRGSLGGGRKRMLSFGWTSLAFVKVMRGLISMNWDSLTLNPLFGYLNEFLAFLRNKLWFPIFEVDSSPREAGT